MKKELQDKLYLDFPQLFQNTKLSMQESCMYFGCDIGDGWYDIMYRLCQRIMTIPDLPENIAFDQVKEKFGLIRIYTNFANKLVDREISIAEVESSKTCECCGTTENVSCTNSGWIKVLCADCHKTGKKTWE